MALKYAQLTLKERYNIEFLIQEGFSNKNIALRLCRDKSTIGREINLIGVPWGLLRFITV
jgi:IS30 family transposase